MGHLTLYSYGEDALTYWAITQRLDKILMDAGDKTPSDAATVFFRPSFGRSGGPASSQFGEFDFVIATRTALHLGETKWDSSSETARSLVELRPEQLERHRIFAAYYTLWISKSKWDWLDFLDFCTYHFERLGIQKPVPPPNSRLSKNLCHILETVSGATTSAPTVNNILLIVKSDAHRMIPVWQPPQDFKLSVIDATCDVRNGFLKIAGSNAILPGKDA